jgi:hypothetical protein
VLVQHPLADALATAAVQRLIPLVRLLPGKASTFLMQGVTFTFVRVIRVVRYPFALPPKESLTNIGHLEKKRFAVLLRI